ncbi:MAG: selenocysteine-specific translation elongation factor [Anaerolineae bacterium]|nr:selenocysteine-specific translation elongation factor [Thermoflexales bacterium]MDW8408127.1 selenocysteine-specific translation elongation factor [Anaerolineae bacterium]
MPRQESTPGAFATRVVATAGHVDHGKSTLVRALTGIDPDRLREEQARQMTIDLGFAWLDLSPPHRSLEDVSKTDSVQTIRVGLIDVPGHIDFIENMLAGVGGIDAALIVIAADEGPMPQTYEHLAILDVLRVPLAVVALTKIDLAPSMEWIDLVRAEVMRILSRTRFAGAPIVPVSAHTGYGLDTLLITLRDVLGTAPPRPDGGRARLSIDRVFSMAGFGTIVTGTLLDGALAVGDEVEILPRHLLARVRGLQTHKRQLERVLPGSRVAVNLAGVEVSALARGDVLISPVGWLTPSRLLDVHIEMLGGQDGLYEVDYRAGALRRPVPLKHNAEVKLFCGASERMARVRLLEGNTVAPGAAGWAQLELAAPLAVAAGDRFIIRLPSPSITLGGGTIVDPQPINRYRRRAGRADEATLARLHARLYGAPQQRLESALAGLEFITLTEAGLLQAGMQTGLNAQEIAEAWKELSTTDRARAVGDVIALTAVWHRALNAAVEHVRTYHAAHPLAAGMPRESLRSKLNLSPRLFNALMHLAVNQNALEAEGDSVRLPDFRVRFNSDQQRAVDQLLAQFRAQPWNTPSVKVCRAAVGDAVYDALLRTGVLIQLAPEVVLLRETYDQAVDWVKAFIGREGQLTVAQCRDALGTTRKYALAFLEYLDQAGVTRRVGEARVLR